LKFRQLAITDHGVLYGAIRVYQAAREKGNQTIIGLRSLRGPGQPAGRKRAAVAAMFTSSRFAAKDEAGIWQFG